MSDRRIRALTIEPNKTFDQSLGIDDASYASAKQITLETLQRTKVAIDLDATGGGTHSAVFTDSDFVNATIDANTTINLTGLKDKEQAYLKVNKGVNDIVTIGTKLGLKIEKSQQIGLTILMFEITTFKTATNLDSTIKQLNSQSIENLSILDLSILGGTITAVDHFRWSTNKNICNFSCEFDITASTSLSSIDLSISNWDVDPVYSRNPITGYISSADVASTYFKQSYTTVTGAVIELGVALANTNTAVIRLSGQFLIN